MAKKTVKKPIKKAAAKKPVKKPAVKAKTKAKPTAKKPAAKKAAPKKAIKKVAPLKKAVSTKASPAAKVDYTKAITPLGDRLVIRLTQSEKVTPGGLILLDSTTTTTTGYLKGVVLAAGHGTFTKKGHHKLLDVKIGDTVLFNDYASTKVKFNNEDLHIVHENEVLGVTEK